MKEMSKELKEKTKCVMTKSCEIIIEQPCGDRINIEYADTQFPVEKPVDALMQIEINQGDYSPARARLILNRFGIEALYNACREALGKGLEY